MCLGVLSRGVFYREGLVEGDAVDDGAAFEELLGGVDVFGVDDRVSACGVGGQRQLDGSVVGDLAARSESVADISEARRSSLKSIVPRRGSLRAAAS